MAMHFYLWPIDCFYPYSKYQALLAPISLIAIFFFKSWDILFMGIHTLLLNLYVGYYLLDPEGQENYS
jgi:hypothetical protein